MADRDLAVELDRLESKVDRLTLLVVALLVLELFDVFGDLLVKLGLVALGVAFAGLVVVFLVALREGL